MCCEPLSMVEDGDEQQHAYRQFHIAVNRFMMKVCLEHRGPLAMGQKQWKDFSKKVSVNTDIQI